MLNPGVFVSGGVAVLQLCKEVYVRFKAVKRFREDCQKLAHFVHRIEGFIIETEEDADMTAPGWQAAFSALHDALLEVVEVFEDCSQYGMIRSLLNADEMNLRLSSVAQRLTLSLQLIPIQKAKVTDKRLAEMAEIQMEIKKATFAAARAAEQQSAQLKRLMDQSRVDATKTQEMLAQVLALLQVDQTARQPSAAAAAAGPGPSAGGAGAPPAVLQLQQEQPPAVLTINPTQLEQEMMDLAAEKQLAQRDKKVLEEQYLEQIIAAITAMEAAVQQNPAHKDVPVDLRCPITYQLLQDPVILIESHQTYERAAIQEWLDRGNMKDPITGMHLTSSTLIPNVLVKKLAQEWLDAHPEYKQHLEEATAAVAAAKQQRLQDAAAAAGSSSGGGVSGCKPATHAVAAAAVSALTAKCQIQIEQLDIKEQPEVDQPHEQADKVDMFDLHPKSSAVLAAAAALGAVPRGKGGGGGGGGGGYFFELPPAKAHSSQQHQKYPESQPQQQQQQDVAGDTSDQKKAAQQAFAPSLHLGMDEKHSAQQAYAAMQAAGNGSSMSDQQAAYNAAARGDSTLDEKKAAQQAYAAAVAAAAGGQAAQVAYAYQHQRQQQPALQYQYQQRAASFDAAPPQHYQSHPQTTPMESWQGVMQPAAQTTPNQLPTAHPPRPASFDAPRLQRQQQQHMHSASVGSRPNPVQPMTQTTPSQQQQYPQPASAGSSRAGPTQPIMQTTPSQLAAAAAAAASAASAAAKPPSSRRGLDRGSAASSSSAAPPPRSSASTSSRVSCDRRSVRSSKRGDGDGDSSVGPDDAASMCSAGSRSSKKSVGKSMLGMLKKASYMMVYNPDKC